MGDLRLELFCDDVDRALRFYQEVLGFVAQPPGSATYRPIERDGIRIALQTVVDLSSDHPLLRGGRDVPRGHGVEIVLEVEDLESLHERVMAAGVEVTPLRWQDWGLVDVRLLDPEGHYLRFTTPRPA